MPRKSSEKSFLSALRGRDNSTGDYNSLLFEFIDDSHLQKEFERWIMARLNGGAQSSTEWEEGKMATEKIDDALTPIHLIADGIAEGTPSVTFTADVPGFSREPYTGPRCEFCSQPAYETQGGYELCCPHAVAFGSRSGGGVEALPSWIGPPDRETEQ